MVPILWPEVCSLSTARSVILVICDAKLAKCGKMIGSVSGFLRTLRKRLRESLKKRAERPLRSPRHLSDPVSRATASWAVELYRNGCPVIRRRAEALLPTLNCSGSTQLDRIFVRNGAPSRSKSWGRRMDRREQQRIREVLPSVNPLLNCGWEQWGIRIEPRALPRLQSIPGQRS